MEEKTVVVAGGGITGLSAAYYLQQKAKASGVSLKLHVVEKASHWGGKIATDRRDGFILEEGPDSFLARKTAAVDLCRELGLEDQLVGTNPKTSKNYIIHKGKLHVMPSGTMLGIPAEITPFAKTSLLSVPGKLRAGMDLFIPKGKQTEDESLGHFLRRRLGNEMVDRLVEPLLSGIYAGDANALSLQATFPLFYELEQKYRSLIRGIVEQRKTIRKQKQQGATEAQDRVKQQSVFLALKTGFATLTDTLAARLEENGADLRTDTGISQIGKKDGQRERYLVGLDNGEILEADAVVLTTPAFVTRKLLAEWIDVTPLAQIPYVSSSIVGLAFSKDAVQSPIEGNGFVVPRKEKRFITASTWVSSKWPHTTPDGKLLFRCFTGHMGDERHKSMSDEEIVREVRRDMKEIMGLTAEPEWTKVMRWNQAMPQYLVHHRQRLEQLEQSVSQKLPGVFLTGAGYFGVGVPDCIAQGRDTADDLVRYLQSPM